MYNVPDRRMRMTVFEIASLLVIAMLVGRVIDQCFLRHCLVLSAPFAKTVIPGLLASDSADRLCAYCLLHLIKTFQIIVFFFKSFKLFLSSIYTFFYTL